MNQYKIPVSINCICKNEETILESAIDSVAPYVEEILFVDHYSFDNTLEIAKKLQKRHDNFRILEKRHDLLMNYTDVREFARTNSKCDYVMKYDGDFILTDHEILKTYVDILKESDQRLTLSDRRLTLSDRRLTLSDRMLTLSDRRLTLSDKVIAISFLVNDLFRDINHIVNRNGYSEPYVFKKDAIHFYNNGEFPDAYKIINKGIIKKKVHHQSFILTM